MSQGLMLCVITVVSTFRKVNDVACKSALNAVHCSSLNFAQMKCWEREGRKRYILGLIQSSIDWGNMLFL